MKDMTVSKALKWIFIAQILCLLAFIPVVGAVLALIGFILNLVALYGASKLEKGYHTALILTVVGIVLSVLSLFSKGVFGTIVAIVSTVVSLGILYFVVMTTNGLLSDSELVAKGEKIWKINLICTIASVVLSLLSFVPVLAGILAVVVAIVEIVATILYLIYLNKSSKALA